MRVEGGHLVRDEDAPRAVRPAHQLHERSAYMQRVVGVLRTQTEFKWLCTQSGVGAGWRWASARRTRTTDRRAPACTGMGKLSRRWAGACACGRCSEPVTPNAFARTMTRASSGAAKP
jgi:hypothetical protein